MKTFLTLVVIVACSVLLEVSLIYIGKVTGGKLGFTIGVRPTMDVF
jgi:hypothetical protein